MSVRYALSRPASGLTEPKTRLSVSELVVERQEAGTRRILDRVALTVDPSEVVAVTGPSGAGKTTLLHAIAGLVRPDAGAITWAGLELTRMSERERDCWRRDTVGLVFQDFQLVDELDVVGNILLPASFDHWLPPSALRDRAKELMSRVGLAGRRARTAALSRGEQQRVAIARALVRGPKLVLADEPTASLDGNNAIDVADLLLTIAADSGAGVLMVSHDPVLLAKADRIHRIERGCLTGAGA